MVANPSPSPPTPEPSLALGKLKPLQLSNRKLSPKWGVQKGMPFSNPTNRAGSGKSASLSPAEARLPVSLPFESIYIWEPIASAGLGALLPEPHPQNLHRPYERTFPSSSSALLPQTILAVSLREDSY